MELKPKEIKTPVYWLHILIIVLIVYFLVSRFVEPMEITVKNVLLGIIFLGFADILSHSMLKIN